jgi:hypothetical protein
MGVAWKSVIPHTTPRTRDEGTRAAAACAVPDAERHAATSERLYLGEHIRFIVHERKQILLLDLANCSAAEVEKIFRATPERVSARPRGSVLILSDFSGARLDAEAIRVMKETAVFDKPFVKKSAWIGAENLPRSLSDNLGAFSRREFRIFETRHQALAWLVKD